MTSKELIEKIKHIGVEEWRLAAEKIEKDLDMLEILKKHYDNDSLTNSLNKFISFYIFEDDEYFNKIKEWLDSAE